MCSEYGKMKRSSGDCCRDEKEKLQLLLLSYWPVQWGNYSSMCITRYSLRRLVRNRMRVQRFVCESLCNKNHSHITAFVTSLHFFIKCTLFGLNQWRDRRWALYSVTGKHQWKSCTVAEKRNGRGKYNCRCIVYRYYRIQ